MHAVPKGASAFLHSAIGVAMPTPVTLKKSKDFKHIANHGKKFITKGVVVQCIAPSDNSDEPISFGYTVSKKVSKKAVERNLVKRRLREIARAIYKTHGQNGYRYVLIARKMALSRPFETLKGDVKYALRHLHTPKA